MKRYESTLIHKAGERPYALMSEDAEGDYVGYEDAIAAVLAERERCAKLVEEGFPRKIVDHYCPHKRLQWEDCDLCVVDAIRASSPSLHTAEQEVG